MPAWANSGLIAHHLTTVSLALATMAASSSSVIFCGAGLPRQSEMLRSLARMNLVSTQHALLPCLAPAAWMPMSCDLTIRFKCSARRSSLRGHRVAKGAPTLGRVLNPRTSTTHGANRSDRPAPEGRCSSFEALNHSHSESMLPSQA